MLRQLKLDNFKIWRSTGTVRLAGVNLLLGTNSSGKSSLIQSLLLIRQTVKSGDANTDLLLGNQDHGDTVVLGQFSDVLCRRAIATPQLPATQFGIEFQWETDESSDGRAVFSARYRRGMRGSAELEFLHLGFALQGFSVQRKRKGVYRLHIDGERRAVGMGAQFRPQRSFAFSPATLASLGQTGLVLQRFGPALLEELSKIIYLGPVRKLAQRDYLWSGVVPASIGDDGANAVDMLIASGVGLELALRKKQPTERSAWLFYQVAEWLKRMNLADGLKVRSLGASARYELLIETQGEFSNLKDVGVGVSQVLPVLVAALSALPGHIVVVEEPESHLHPLAQSELANLFATVSRQRRVQFIVETHSEHLFRRLQTLLAEGALAKEDCALYFVERDGKDASLKPLEADELGRIRNWPDKFFGDTLGETRRQTELAIRQARERRAKDGNVVD